MWWILVTMLAAQAAPPVPTPELDAAPVGTTSRWVFKPTTFQATVPAPDVTVLLSRDAVRAPSASLPAAPRLTAHIQRDLQRLP